LCWVVYAIDYPPKKNHSLLAKSEQGMVLMATAGI
jgi:hypothetical protein